MELKHNEQSKIRFFPRQSSSLLLLSAVLLLFSGAVVLLLHFVFSEEKAVNRLLPQIPAILFAVTGGLLLLCRRRTELFIPAACVLTAACLLFYPRYNMAGLALLAALLLVLSATGWIANIRFSAPPKWLQLSGLNLASAVLSILACLTGIGDTVERFATAFDLLPGFALALTLLIRLPLVAVAVLNFSVEPQPLAEGGSPRHVVQSVVQPETPCFQAAAWALIICGAGGLLKATLLIHAIGFSPLFYSLLLDLPLIAAAILLLQNGGREKRFLTSVLLLGLHVLLGAARSGEFSFWTLLVPVLLMLLSCAGAEWNTVAHFMEAKTHAPVLNLASAALLLVNMVVTVWESIPKYPEAVWPAWHAVALALLLPLGLILLNLSLGSRTAQRQRGGGPSQAAYRHGFSRLVRWIYGDVGGHLKALAKIQGIFFLLTAALSLLTAALGLFSFLAGMASGGEAGGGLAMLLAVGSCGFVGSVLLVLFTWPLYAFGQITSDVHALKKNGSALSEENPDELPEL